LIPAFEMIASHLRDSLSIKDLNCAAEPPPMSQAGHDVSWRVGGQAVDRLMYWRTTKAQAVLQGLHG
jgi:hypothetical protein